MKRLPSCLGEFRPQESQEQSASQAIISRFQPGSRLGMVASQDKPTSQLVDLQTTTGGQATTITSKLKLFAGASKNEPVFRVIHGFSPADSRRGIGCLSSVKNLAISSPFVVNKSSSQDKHQTSKVPLELKYAAATIAGQTQRPHRIELVKKINSLEPPGYFGTLRLDKDSRVQRLMAKHDSTRRLVRRRPGARVHKTHLSALEEEFGDMIETESQYMNNTVGGKMVVPDPGTLRSLANQKIDTQTTLSPLNPYDLQENHQKRMEVRFKIANLQQPDELDNVEGQQPEPRADSPRGSGSELSSSMGDWALQGKSDPQLRKQAVGGIYKHNPARTAPMLPPSESMSRDKEVLQLRALQQRGAGFPESWKKYGSADSIGDLVDRSEGVGLRGETVFVKVANLRDNSNRNQIGARDFESKDPSTETENLDLRTQNLAEMENLRVTLLESIIRGQEAPQLQKILQGYVSDKNQTDYCEIPIQELQEIDLARYPRWMPPNKKLQAGSFFTETGYQTSGAESSHAMTGSVAEYQRMLKRELYS